MIISEKVAYLAGLIDGLDYDSTSREGRVFNAILDALEEIAEEMDDMRDDLDELGEFVEALDEDMEEIEEILDFDHDHEDDDDDELIDIQCPACGYMNSFDPDIIWSSDGDVDVHCINCDAVIFSGEDFSDDDLDEEDD
ncbi:MAG: zinc ribbon domain-containing protein [Clostridiales bacterium]|nr:zinc ribbon domain-containing protein [Clostridiales bacterium]